MVGCVNTYYDFTLVNLFVFCTAVPGVSNRNSIARNCTELHGTVFVLRGIARKLLGSQFCAIKINLHWKPASGTLVPIILWKRKIIVKLNLWCLIVLMGLKNNKCAVYIKLDCVRVVFLFHSFMDPTVEWTIKIQNKYLPRHSHHQNT